MIREGDARYVVKASVPSDKHIAREIYAHHHWMTPWRASGRVPTLVFSEPDESMLATTYLPGRLVQGSAFQAHPDTYRQAGELLAQMHTQAQSTDPDYEKRANESCLEWLDAPHRVAPGTVALLRDMVRSWPVPPSVLVPTHGDWQPRNWLVHADRIYAIDFGRAALRPAITDFGRLHVQDFRRDPALRAAFIEGYGSDPLNTDAWSRHLLREAVSTTAWAFQHGDQAFEAQGHRMITEALEGRI
jgi:hypothetical protein